MSSFPEVTVPSTVQERLDAWTALYDDPGADVAELLCDGRDPAATAFRFVDAELGVREYTYGELADRSRRIAAVLRGRGVGEGDRVAVLMGKREELVSSLLAIWRLGAVHVPLFTAFATSAIEMRLAAGGVRVVLTEPDQQGKVDGLVGPLGLDVLVAGAQFEALVADAEPLATSVAVGGQGGLVHLFTSGTTGTPKAVPVPVRALSSFASYMVHGLDVRPDDVFWNAADPGWAYGLYYGILGPLAIGVPNVLLAAGFSAPLTKRLVETLGVTNFAAAPTVYRSLAKGGLRLDRPLRRASSAGEPLTPDVNLWAVDALGTEVRDHYGQTELGMVISNGWHDDLRAELRPGSMGRALPGFAACMVGDTIALDVAASPMLWFAGYVDAPERTAERFSEDGRFYLTGDAGRAEDGWFYFSSRDDDVIIMAGYRIGPFDVESVLSRHPAVAEVAVVGKPDEVRGEVVEAFVVLADGHPGSDALVADLQQFVKSEFAAHAFPRRVHFVEALPKTPSGKIQRFVLRKLEV
jgi:acetyl-CoA synthetase